MCQTIKKLLSIFAVSLLFLFAASSQDMQRSATEYEIVELTEFLESNQNSANLDIKMNSSQKQTDELKLEIPSLNNMPILWPEASTESEKSLTAQKLNSMGTSELWNLLDNQLETLDSALAQLEQSVISSKKETELLKKNIENIRKEKEAAEKVIEHLKVALASNKEDQSLVNSLLGEQLIKIEQIESEVEKLKKYVSFLELQETRLKRNGVSVPICIATSIGGAIVYTYGLTQDNKDMVITGLVIMAAPTVVWSAGHWFLKWW